MKQIDEIYFGEKDTFAIRYIPRYKQIDKQGNIHYYATLHLVLNNKIIGNPEEECYLSTWLFQVERFKNKIFNNFESLKNSEFKNRSDDEIFELIYKSNQVESEFGEKYSYLPILDNTVWQNCTVNIDETIDAYQITIIEYDSNLKFIWKGWRSPCKKEDIDKLFSIVVNRNEVIKILEDCLTKVKSDILQYQVK